MPHGAGSVETCRRVVQRRRLVVFSGYSVWVTHYLTSPNEKRKWETSFFASVGLGVLAALVVVVVVALLDVSQFVFVLAVPVGIGVMLVLLSQLDAREDKALRLPVDPEERDWLWPS